MKKYTIENANEIIAGIPDNDTYKSIKDALLADGYKLKTIDIDNFVYFFSNGEKIIAVYRFWENGESRFLLSKCFNALKCDVPPARRVHDLDIVSSYLFNSMLYRKLYKKNNKSLFILRIEIYFRMCYNIITVKIRNLKG